MAAAAILPIVRLVAFAASALAMQVVLAQGSPVYHQPDPAQEGIFLAHLDVRGCVERVREPETQWHGRAPTIVWSGTCVNGLRDGTGTMKLYQGRQLVATSTGRFVDGYRAGPWAWEYPDGRRMEARMPGSGTDPLERIMETPKGERMRQLLAGGQYIDDPSGSTDTDLPAPPPAEPVAVRDLRKPVPVDAVRYAAANFRVGTCAGRGRYDASSDFLATRSDVDHFIREGESAVRTEADRDLFTWQRSITAIAIRLAALAGTRAPEYDAFAQELAEMHERLAWGRCHRQAGYPWLARMIEAVPACERASMLRAGTVRTSGNPRVQAVLAECVHGSIHSTRWPK